MGKFTELKEGEYIWGVYDLNWDKDIPSEYKFYPTEYKLDKYLIIKNDINVERRNDVSDRYEPAHYVTYYENWLEINFLGMKYSRFYTNHYDEYRHMPIHSEFNDNGPWVEFFPDYETAKEYLKVKCNNEIEYCKKTIEKEKYKISLLEKSLEQIKE